MADLMFSQFARGAGFCVALFCMSGPVMAKMPEAGGPTQFDLFCQGRDELILDDYIPTVTSGTGHAIPKVEKVRMHVIVDMNTMKFLVIDSRYIKHEFRKIAPSDDGLLHLYNQIGYRRWVINLTSYKSNAVWEDEGGTLIVEKMQCRPGKFSGFGAARNETLYPAIVPRGSH